MKVAFRFTALIAFIAFFETADAGITSWTTPTISGDKGTGTLSVSETQELDATITTYMAVTDATSIKYTLVPEEAPFSLTEGGELTIKSTSLVFGTKSSYTLNIIATDDGTATGTATITVSVTENATPAFGLSAYTACITTGSTQGTTLATTIATDSDGDQTVTHSLESGNTNDDFKIDGTTGVITVDTGKTLDMATTPTYTLVVYAMDDFTANKKTGSTVVSVQVTADGTCSKAIAVGVSIMTILMALFVSV